MKIYYYLTIFPIESLIASNLEPTKFGSYLSTGSKKGSYENNIFIEIEEGCSNFFDWDYAKKKCVPKENVEPKHSVYLSIYRTLENTPIKALKSIYLTTKDGRTLEIKPEIFDNNLSEKKFYIYQEICPTRPLIVTSLKPKDYVKNITNKENKTYIPTIAFADIKTISFHSENTGSLGPLYDRNIEHLHNCVNEVTLNKDKLFKIVERSNVDKFSYQIIGDGIFVGDNQTIIFYRMISVEDLRRYHYDWARSAQIF